MWLVGSSDGSAVTLWMKAMNAMRETFVHSSAKIYEACDQLEDLMLP